ncbi:MAG: acetoin utilization deacetylase AcuC-like enzyme [Bradymonadia bacterium]|jgi:acetoin utilization deacetylase AcuC-like enzyme
MPVPAYFHPDQLTFKPKYEWAFGTQVGHPETTARAESILRALTADSGFEVSEPEPIKLSLLRKTHSPKLITLYRAAERLGPEETFYPSVFPKAQVGKGDPTNVKHAGAFCFDSGTPLSAQTWTASRWSASCAAQAAYTVLAGAPVAYALSRPPGHHATRSYFGGYSYFNNSAIAARILQKLGRVAVLDIDFHHGNGTQTIFESNPDVLSVSIHGDPLEFYPYFCGYPNERGAGAGEGYNLNITLPRGATGEDFIGALVSQAMPAIEGFAPDALVVSAGFDTFHKDPVGDFELQTSDYEAVGRLVASLKLPTAVIQEGGYFAPALGDNVVSLLSGLAG